MSHDGWTFGGTASGPSVTRKNRAGRSRSLHAKVQIITAIGIMRRFRFGGLGTSRPTRARCPAARDFRGHPNTRRCCLVEGAALSAPLGDLAAAERRPPVPDVLQTGPATPHYPLPDARSFGCLCSQPDSPLADCPRFAHEIRRPKSRAFRRGRRRASSLPLLGGRIAMVLNPT
jgi:hypothetical protein